MNDIRKLLDIINETTAGATASGGVAPVSQSMHTQRRVEEDYSEESSDKPQMPQILEYGNWENSALTTSKKLKKSRKKASKIVKSVYGEDMPSEKVAVSESVVDESGLQAYLGNKKYGKEGMDTLRRAGREGASKEKMAKLRAKYDKLDEENVAEGSEKNPHTSALGKALYRDLSKQPKLSPQQVQRNKERWAKRQAEREQGVAEGSDGNFKSGDQVYHSGRKEIGTFLDYDDRNTTINNNAWVDFDGEELMVSLDRLSKVQQGVAEGYNDISVGDYVSYDDGPGTDRWEVVSIEGNRVELRNDQGGTTFADINDVLKEQGMAEGLEDTNPLKRAIDIATSLGYSVKKSRNGKIVTFHSVPSQLTMKAKLVNLSGKDMVYWEAGGAYDTISVNKFPNFFKGLHQAHMHDIKKDKKGVAEGFNKEAEAWKKWQIDNLDRKMEMLSRLVKKDEWLPSEEDHYTAIKAGYNAMIKTGNVNDAAKAISDTFKEIQRRQGVAKGYKNTYEVGDRVNSPLGTGTITAVSKNVNVDGKVKVKLDDPSQAGEDGKHKDTFVLTTTQLTHISD